MVLHVQDHFEEDKDAFGGLLTLFRFLVSLFFFRGSGEGVLFLIS